MKKLIIIFTLMGIQLAALGQDARRLLSLRGDWKFSIGDREEWASPDYDDSDWEEVYVPERWEREGFNGYDGYAWYRTQFDGKGLKKDRYHLISLGYIDDVDEVFINGVKIGFSGGFSPNYYTAWNAERLYLIPPEVLKYDGDNQIAVRVYDQGGEGGIYSGSVGIMYLDDLTTKDGVYLEGLWKIRIDDDPRFIDPDYDDSRWEDIMVPSNWKTIGINDLRDFAWYRKTFTIPSGGQTREMTLIGGRIDDFDEVYINGVKIGGTNDGRRLGSSRSYSELRFYNIPDGVLKEGKNVISVRVEDIGDNGGIYEGPVIIMPTDAATRYVRRNYWWR
ncbi:beta galactosidase jelly roll domain-containing protein [Roseivirga sp.]|uniref:beta galactosidase jelly roll domain-containing protein n=1 Tax=Roseivirga sp. TaxID=1964215 RepID=UPI003B51E302